MIVYQLFTIYSIEIGILFLKGYRYFTVIIYAVAEERL
jgi:hypothetical protein